MSRSKTPETGSVERKGKSLSVAAKRAAAGLAIFSTASIGLGACSTTEASPTKENTDQPVATAEATTQDPTEQATTPEATQAPELVTPESMQIPSDLPPEELAQSVVDIVHSWMFAGSSSEEEMTKTADAWYDFDGTMDEFKNKLLQENTGFYAAVLLGENWADNPETAEIADRFTLVNESMLVNNMHNDAIGDPLWNNNLEISDVSEVETNEDNTRSITFTLRETFKGNNRDNTSLTSAWNLQFDVSSGKALITSLETSETDRT